MNSANTKNTAAPQSARDLQRILNQMEKNGASLLDRTQAAVDFIETQKKNSAKFSNACDSGAADQGFANHDDPDTSERDPVRSGQEADRTGPTSGHDAVSSAHDADTSAQQPDPELPRPPKFQFGPGNELYDIALDFRAFRDKRSILDRLSEHDRIAIYKLMDVHTDDDVIDLLAKSPPAGLGIHVGRSSLIRFRKRYQKQARLKKRLAFQLECDRLLAVVGNDDQAFLRASERLLKMRLFDITGDPAADTDKIAQLADIIVKLRKQSLAEQKHVQSADVENEDAQDKKEPANSEAPAIANSIHTAKLAP